MLEKKIKALESQLPEKGSKSLPCSDKVFKSFAEGPHRDKIATIGDHSSEFYGMVHTPVTSWKNIPEAAAALDNGWVKLEKLPAWDPKQVREKSDVKAESNTSGIPVHFADLMARCFLKNAELAKHLQKYKGRVVLRGDNIKDK